MLTRAQQNEIYGRECVLAGMMLTNDLMEEINNQPLCNTIEWAQRKAHGFACGEKWLL